MHESDFERARRTAGAGRSGVHGSEGARRDSTRAAGVGGTGLDATVWDLQHAVGNAAVGQLLARGPLQRELSGSASLGTDEIREAYEAATPSPLATVDDLIRLVTRVEAAYPNDNWQAITTRIRKSYYDDNLWNRLIVRRATHEGVSAPPLTMADYRALVEARDHPGISLPTGDVIDVGHVFAGMDAANFPETNWMFSLAGISGPAGATWAGDVGSALAMWDFRAGRDRSRRQEFYDNFASRDDMLGDVDAIALASPRSAPATGGDRLSGRLRAYYLPQSGAAGASRRFTKFAQASGFAWLGQGSTIGLDPGAQRRIRQQIENFAVQYRRNQAGAIRGAGTNWFHEEDVTWFVNRFVRWLENGLAAENP